VLGVRRDDVALDHRQHLRQHLEDRHPAAERREHRGELHADDPPPITARRRGTCLSSRIWSESIVSSAPGSGIRATAEPVAMTMSLACSRSPEPRPRLSRQPRAASKGGDTAGFQEALDTLTSWSTTWLFLFCAAGQSNPMLSATRP